MKKVSPEQLFWSLLGLMALTSAVFSLLIGMGQSVWFDEAYSVLVAEHSWREIVSLTVQDVHPPLYYWLLKAWMGIFGSSELALRSLSALFLGLSIGTAGLLMRKLFGAKTALIALPLVAFAPFLLRYGFEIRMYAFVSFVGIAATYVLVRAVEESERRQQWALFGVYSLLVVVGVYSLYFMALIWAAHVMWLAWRAYRERRRDVFTQGLAAYLVAFVLFVPWLLLYLDKNGSGVDTLSPVTHTLGLDNLLGIVTFMFLYQPSWQLGAATLAGVASILLGLLYLGITRYKKANMQERRYLALCAVYFLVPVLILIAATQFKPIYLERYIAHFAVGGYMTVGALVALAVQRGGIISQVAAVGLSVTLFAGCINLVQAGNYNFQRLHTPSVKRAAELMADCKNGTVIFADGPQVAVELGYYVKDCPIRFFNETLEMSGGFAMLSGSPLRVADARVEFQDVDKLLYIYYDQPTRVLPAHLSPVDVVEVESLYVATYERTGVN